MKTNFFNPCGYVGSTDGVSAATIVSKTIEIVNQTKRAKKENSFAENSSLNPTSMENFYSSQNNKSLIDPAKVQNPKSRKETVSSNEFFNSKKSFKSLFASLVIILAVFVVGLGSAWGQTVANYVFAQSTGNTYTELSSPTVLYAANWDQGVSSVNLPFAFNFKGKFYTSINVSSNGFITFGSTAPTTTNYTPISSTATYEGCISAWGRDLGGGASSTISYKTIDNAPNRTFVVQWTNAQRYATSLRAGTLSFQIRLSETSNNITVSYGPGTAGYATDLTLQVGLRGSANTDYSNRTTTNNWPASTAGVANNATCNTGTGTGEWPANGLNYTWSCSAGAPAAFTISGPTAPCVGTVLYQAASGTGTEYWFTPTGWTGSGGANYIATANSTSGSVTCIRTASSGCGAATSSTNTISVTPVSNAPASVSAGVTTTPVCVGGTVALQGGGTNVSSWSWVGPNNYTSSTEDPSISSATTAATGTYFLSASNSCGSGGNLFDNFNDGNSTATPIWTAQAGAFNTNSPQLQGTDSNTDDIISTPSTQAYGSWKFDFQLAATTSTTNAVRFFLISSNANIASTNGYYLRVDGGNQIILYRIAGAIATTSTAIGTYSWTSNTSVNTILVTRNSSNVFQIYLNGTSLGTVTDANYTTSSFAGVYNTGTAVTVNHIVDNIVCSDKNVAVSVQSISTAPSISGTYCAGNTTVTGTGVAGASISVIRSGSSIGTATVGVGGTWTATVSTLAASDVLTATQTESGKCVSSASSSVTVLANSSAPAISSSYCPGATTVTGTGINGSSISVIRGGTSIGTATVGVGGTWSATVSTLAASDVLTATQTESGKCVSSASSSVTVQTISATPAITGSICPGNTTVSGTGINGSSINVIRSGSSIGTATVSGGVWTATVSSVNAGDALTVTQTEVGKCVSATAAYTVITPASWGNIQFPATSQIICGSPVTFYGQVYRAGTTEAAGQGASLTADLGWSNTDSNPNEWTNWTSASFNTQSGNNDEFSAALGAGLTQGTWYYAFRYSYAGCPIYGGYGGVYGSGGSNGTASVPASQTAVLSSAVGTNAQTICKGLSIVNITYTLGNGATGATVTGLPAGITSSVSGSTLTISGTVTHANSAGLYTYSIVTSGASNCAFTITGTITANESVDYANLQSPTSGVVCTAGSFNVYGQVYEPGVTPGAVQGGGITVQAGYNSANTNPSTWSTWQATTYNAAVTGNNDEYSSTFSSLNTDGVYYYAFKYTNNASGCVTYGGLNGSWDATTSVSGVMTVMGPTAGTVGSGQTLCNTGSGVTPAAFTSTANGSGSGTISYEWQTNASGSYATIAGANSATYQAPTLTATTSYQRRTVATSGGVTCYSAYTSPITVTVNNAISITGQPNTSAASVCLNGAAFTALTVTATGTSPTYQWQQSADGSTNWITAVGGTGGTTSSYTPPNNLVGTLYYRCVVSGASPCSSVNSDPSGARNVLSVPTITSFSPAAGCTGTTITINGTNFVNGSTTVTVNGIAATSVTFVSSSQITVLQPAGVTGTGNIVVTLPGSCSATSSSTFSLLAVPAQPSAITGTANPEVGATAQAYSVTNVAGVTYTWSFPSGWTITSGQGTNSVQVTVGSVNGTISVTPSNCAGNGTATTLATTIPAYRAKFTGVNFGASTWCAGTSRSVTVNVTNTGTATWTDAGPDINIGVKWNTNGTNWNDYMYRQNAGGLAPGASQVYTFASLQASNATANVAPPSVPAYGTNLATGTNILSFDVVAEGCFWFSGNTANATCPGVVSGNSVYQSTSITITDVPAQPSAITGTASVCSNVSQSYSVTNVAGLTYNWTFPSGWTQTAGGTTNSVTVTTGAAGGSISVTAANTCGNSTARTLAVANAGPTSVSGGSDATTCYNVGTQLSGSATAPIVSGSTFATYSVGNANTLYAAGPTTATVSSCPIPLSVTIPVGATITGVSVNYTMTAQGSGWKSDQRSYLKCTNSGGTTEAAVSIGTGNATGANPYSRTGLTIANAVSGGGTINFQLHAFQTLTGTGCASTYNYVANNTFIVTVFYTAPASITYAWSPTTGLSSSTISNPIATLTSDETYTMTATSNGCSVAASPITITVRPQFTPGAIATTGETICSGGTPSQIGSTTAASGGDNSITYSWRSSADSYATAISGATDATYTPPSGLSTTTSYRRYAKDNTCNLTPTVSTGTWTVTVNAIPTAGAIASAQSICNGNAPSLFTSSTDGTGTGTVSYEWQTNASGSYATIGSEISSTYQAPVLSATTSYQRRTVAVSGGVTCYSTYTSPVTITVNGNPTLSGITSSSTTVCAGDVATITLSGILDVPQTISYTIGGTVGTQTATVTGVGGSASFNTITLTTANGGQTIIITGITRTDVTPNCPFTPSSGNTATLPSVNSCSLITPSTSSLTAFSACTNVASSEQSFTVIGSDLTADILVTAPTGFQVSLNSGSGFGSLVSLTQSAGSVASTTIYVRMLSASTPVNGNITLASSGAVTQNVSVSGSVNQLLSAVSISGTNNQTICSNASGSLLTVSETNGGVITSRQWGYRTTSGGAITSISGVTGATYTPSGADLPAGISYIVCTSTPTCGSAVVSNEITVTETVLPTITASTSNFGCGTGTVGISATASAGTIEWFDASTNGTSLGTSNSAATWTTPSIASTTIYYAEAINATCRSTSRTAVTATITAIPAVTFIAQPGATTCSSTNLTYTTESGQSNYVWTFPGTLNTDYTIVSGGTTSSNTVTLQYLTAGSKTVTVNYASSGCSAVSATSSIATTVSITPANPSVSDATICVGESTILSASSSEQIKWYDGLGNFINTGSTYNVTPTTTTTYYAVAQAGTVNVVPYSASTTFVVPTGVEQVKVEAWGAGGSGGAGRGSLVACWYCYSAGGGGGGGAFSRSTFNVIAGQNYTLTVGLGVAGTTTSNGSAGGSSVFTGPAGTVTALGGSGGVRGADGTPGAGGAGGIGLFNGGNGAAGDLSSYYNNGGGGGGGAGNAANGANASMASDAVGGPGGAGGIGSPNISPYFGGAGGSFPIATYTSAGSAGSVPGGGGSGGGGDGANRAGGIGGNGRIVLTYTSYTGCASALTPVLVTVNPAPTVNAGSAMSAICSGQTSAQLGGSIGGSATGGTWTHNGAGSLTNPTDPSAATYTAGASESGTVTLTLTTTGGGCTAITATKTIVVNAIPAAPTVPVNLTICQSGIGNISVTAPTLTSSQNVAFNIATEPTETNAAPGNQIATATISALPSGTTITSAALTVNNLTALGGSYMSEVMLGLSGAVTYSAVAGSSTGAAGAFNYSSTVSSGITVNTASTALNLLYWDYANDNFGADCTFGAPKTANLTINYSYPATINWYDAATGGTLLGTGASFNPIGTTVLPNANTAGTYNFYAEAVSNGCASARVLVTVTVQNANNTTVAAIVGSDLVAGDYLWNGNTTTSWETAANWFKHDGTNFLYSTTVPTASNRVFVLTNANAGSSCISTTNLATVNVSVGTGAASDVFIGAGATMLMDAGKILNVSGNWTNNGLFTPNATASVVFNGTGAQAQAIGGSSTTTFTNLEVNKTSGLLTLNTPANVSGTLTMTAGNIATRLSPTVTNLLTVGTSASATGTIAWTSGSVLGPIKRWFAAGITNTSDASTIFPVGLSTKNRWAKLNFTSGLTTGGTITAEYKSGVAPVNNVNISNATGTATYLNYAGLPAYVNGQMVTNYENEGYWSIAPGTASDGELGSLNTTPYSLKLRGNTLTGVTIGAMSQLRMIKSTTHTSWDNVGVGAYAYPANISGNESDFTITNTGMTGFSWFNIGSGSISWLPIELVNFTANCNEKSQVDVKWTTASEQNSENFIIERSRDLAAWEYVSTVNAAGNSNYNINYATVDTDPFGGVSYYRLVQVDNNGSEKIYGPISVSCSGVNNSMIVFPNPTKGNFTVEISSNENISNAQIQITDLTGKVIIERSTNILEGKSQFTFEGLDLQLGTYIINLNTGNGKINPVRVVVN